MGEGFARGYALSIGIADYKHLPKVDRAATDAHDLRDTLVDRCGYPETHVRLLKDRQATRQAILEQLAWLADEAAPDGVALIYFSGRGARLGDGTTRRGGIPPADLFEHYKAGVKALLRQLEQDSPPYEEALVYEQRLVANIVQSRRYGDTENWRAERNQIIDRLNHLAIKELNRSFNELCGPIPRPPSWREEYPDPSPQEFLCPVDADVAELEKTAISGQEFIGALRAIRSKKLVVFLDVCHTGRVGELDGIKLGITEGFYQQLSCGNGLVIIASCEPGQVSWKFSGMRNGLFAHHLLNGLRGKGIDPENGQIHIRGLFTYLSQAVPEDCRENKVSVIQQPIQRPRDTAENFPVALIVDEGWTPVELRERWREFDELANLVRRGKAVLVIGPGVSADVDMPTGEAYLQVIEESRAREESETVLKRGLRGMIGTHKGRNPDPDRRGGYRLLLTIAKFFPLIVTTNWDGLLSESLDLERPPPILRKLKILPESDEVPPLIELRGHVADMDRMFITDITPQSLEESLPQEDWKAWQDYTGRDADYSFVFVGYQPGSSEFQQLRGCIPERRYFFVAPIPAYQKGEVFKQTGAQLIPTSSENLVLALFQELRMFADRREERESIFDRAEILYLFPFIEFHGEFGSGKSALLDEITKRAEREGWDPGQIWRINWIGARDGKPQVQLESQDPVRARPTCDLDQVIQNLPEGEPLFLALDQTERIEAGSLQQLLGEIASLILDLNDKGKRSKLLACGRRAIKKWPARVRPYKNLYSSELPPLSRSGPGGEDPVHEMAVKFLLAADPGADPHFPDELLDDILEVSRGNPRFVKDILVDLTSARRRRQGRIQLPTRLDAQAVEQYVKRFSDDIDDYILADMDAQTRPIYEDTLCVFRFLDMEILDNLDIDRAILEKLIALGVFTDIPYPYLADPLIRYVKGRRLYHRTPDAYKKAHRRAQEIFGGEATEFTDRSQQNYIVEWLFHQTHWLLAEMPGDGEEKRRCNELSKWVNAFQFRYRRHSMKKPGEKFVKRVKREDEELLQLLISCIGEHGWNQLSSLLEDKEEQRV